MSGVLDRLRSTRGTEHPDRAVRMQGVWRGTVIAESDATVTSDGTVYFPQDSLQVRRSR